MKHWLLGWGLVWVTSLSAVASHIMGGNLSLVAGTRDGEFSLALHLIYNDNGSVIENQVTVSIFKKSDNSRITDFILSRDNTQSLPFINARCVGTSPVQVAMIRYTNTVNLPTTTYNDPAGYYVAWEQCCRNGTVANIANARNAGLTFYLEIPAVSLKNNAPLFNTPEVKYACRGQLYELTLGATDADKDELRYSLVTPLAGFTDAGTPSPTRPRAGPYPRARWAAGFDSTRVAGSTSQIDSKTGKITFIPNQLGRFAVSVLCEEIRNNQKIGEVRRDFEVIVVDCISETLPPVLVEIKTATPSVTFGTLPSGHINSVQRCSNDSLTLKANDESPQWNYQWRRNGAAVAGGNQVTLSVKEEGTYLLIKKRIQSCNASDSTTATTIVTNKSGTSAKITSARRLPLCEGDSTELSVAAGATATFEWEFDNAPLKNRSAVLSGVKFPGLYRVQVSDATTKCSAKDSLLVKVVMPPTATAMVVGNANFCSDDSTKLTTTKQSYYDYVWYVNDTPTTRGFGAEYFPSQSGRYYVMVKDTTTGCTSRSATLNVVYRKSPIVTFDSIPPLCGTGIQAVTLNASPKGGTFTGRGVISGRFVSQNLPSGSYPVVYTYTNPEGCSAKTTQAAVVMPPPKVSSPAQLTVFKGESIEIKTGIPTDATVRWFPSAGLDDATAPRPQASPDRTTIYTLTVTTREGCVVEADVTVEVIELKIPNGFTPNADGANDTWEIEGIQKYPNCTIEVLNRWGGVVFSSKGYEQPWDGTWKGAEVPVGTYYYQIYLREIEYKLTGSLSVIR